MSEGLNPVMRQPSAWWPVSDPVEVAVLGKLLEELGECTQAASRALIQGFEDSHPITHKPNGDWLLEELADVLACIRITLDHFGVSPADLETRTQAKIDHLREWHQLLRDEVHE